MRTLNELNFLLALTFRSAAVNIAFGTTVLASWFAVVQQASDRAYFWIADGLLAGNSTMRLWIPLLAALVAANLSSTLLATRMLHQVHLSGGSPSRVAMTSTIVGGVAGAAWYLLGMVGAGVLASVVGSRGIGAVSIREVSIECAAVIVVAWVWAWVGACCGAATNSRILAITAILGLMIVSLASERVAVVYPSIENIATITLLGAGTALIYGTFVPDFPQGEVGLGTAVLVLALWVGLSYLAFKSRYSSSRTSQLWERPSFASGDSRRLAGRKRPRSRWLIGALAPVLVPGLVAVGFLLPQYLSEAIPWHLKLSWLSSVAKGTTPADAVDALMLALAEGDDARAMALVVDGRWSEVAQYRLDLIAPGARESAFNIIISDGPGSVAINVGFPEEEADGTILLPRQITACMEESGSGWNLRSISSQGLTCEEADP